MSHLPRNGVTIYSAGLRGIKEEEALVETEHPPGGAPTVKRVRLCNAATSDLTGPLQVVLPAAMEALPAGDVLLSGGEDDRGKRRIEVNDQSVEV